jgi:nicotinate-nucleotide adenylyltransferase
MVALAIAGERDFVLDPRELAREGPSYTLDTVIEMQAAEPPAKWFLLIGADQYAGLHSWRDWPDLLARVTLAVANRPGPLPTPDPAVLGHPHRPVQLPMLDISSTDIRARIAQHHPVTELVPPQVARYIDQHSLYQEGQAH